MSGLRRVLAVTGFGIRTIPARLGSTSVIVVGIGCVVVVLVCVIALAQGFRQVLMRAGQTDRVLVLSSGSISETTSGVRRDEARLVCDAAQIAQGPALARLCATEVLVIADLPTADSGLIASVALRGVAPESFLVRPEVRLVEGRRFVEGKRELIAGRGAAAQFKGLDVGSLLELREERWTVVGIFSSNSDVHESEVWGDTEEIMLAYRRPVYQSVTARLGSPQLLEDLRTHLASERRADVQVLSEPDYYASQSMQITALIEGLGYVVVLLMGTGAAIGAISSMFAAVVARTREIAILMALGFGKTTVVCSVLAEALLLALVGAACGCGVSWVLFDGAVISTINWGLHTQVTWDFDISIKGLSSAAGLACGIGLIGAIVPALRAAYMPVARIVGADR